MMNLVFDSQELSFQIRATKSSYTAQLIL